MMKNLILIMVVIMLSSVAHAEKVSKLRDGEIKENIKPQRIPMVVNNDKKLQRNYPMQPPIIPHKIRGYQINKNVNKCMSCHSRTRVTESQATMISVTHYMNRDGNFLAEISPRRYFCNQCHVTQQDTKAPVKNNFVDMHTLITNSKKKG